MRLSGVLVSNGDSLYVPMRNSDQMTIGKTQPTLLALEHRFMTQFEIQSYIKPTETGSTNEFSALPIWLHHNCDINRNLCKNRTKSK